LFSSGEWFFVTPLSRSRERGHSRLLFDFFYRSKYNLSPIDSVKPIAIDKETVITGSFDFAKAAEENT
jgi:hypothetical protein